MNFKVFPPLSILAAPLFVTCAAAPCALPATGTVAGTAAAAFAVTFAVTSFDSSIVSAAAAAEPPTTARRRPGPCASPRAAMGTLLYWQQTSQYDLEEAARCLDLSAVQNRDGNLVARQLKDILDARGITVNLSQISDDPNYLSEEGEPYVIPVPSLPSIRVEKVGSRWLFSADSTAAVPRLYRRTFVVDVEQLVDDLPPWTRKSLFGVSVWQVLGIGIILLLGWLFRVVVAVVVARQARRIMIRLHATWGAQVLARIDQPLGTMVGAGLLYALFPLLKLPAHLSGIALTCAKLLAAVAGVWGVVRLVDVLSAWMAKKANGTAPRMDDHLVPLARRALKIFTVAVGSIFVLQNLNIDAAGLVAGLGLGGLAVALAAQDTVSNLFGSATIYTDKPFQIGDWVIAQGVEGTVETVGFRSTRIRTFADSLVSIPNSKLAGGPIDNFGARSYRRYKTLIAVPVETSVEQLQAFVDGIRAIILANPHSRKDSYEVYVNDFGPGTLQILVQMFIRAPTWSDELRERQHVILEILRLARALHVTIAAPAQTLHVASVAQTTPSQAVATPSNSELEQIVRSFAPEGDRSRPVGTQITDGYYPHKVT